MKWRYQFLGDHVHVTVFCNGANCGKLVFRNESKEWGDLFRNLKNKIEFEQVLSKEEVMNKTEAAFSKNSLYQGKLDDWRW